MPVDYQQKSIDDIGAAFSTTPGGLSTNQQASFDAVRNAFKKPVTSISTDQGITALNKAKDSATRLAGTPPLQPPTDTGASKATGDKVPEPKTATFINPATEQSATIDISDTNALKEVMSQGYQFAEGTYPSSLYDTTEPEVAASKRALDAADAAITAAVSKLQNLNVSNDPALKSILGGVGAGWDARIQQMRQAEESRIAALGTTGIRLGSQYTGGKGGIMGGIITAEETNMINELTKLDMQKQSALAEAQNAYAKQEYGRYADLVQSAEKAYDRQLEKTKELAKKQADQNEKLVKEITANARATNVAGLMAKGTTDPADIFAELSKTDGTITSKDVADTIKDLTPPKAKDDSFSFSQGQMSQLFANGFSPEQIKGLNEYYNGKQTAGYLQSLNPEERAAIYTVLNGTATKLASSQIPTYAQAHPKPTGGAKPLVSGALTYTPDVLGGIEDRILSTQGDDGYVDPYVYKDGLDAWTASGGLTKDFIKNFPPKNYINPAATWVPQYISTKKGSTQEDLAGSLIKSLHLDQ